MRGDVYKLWYRVTERIAMEPDLVVVQLALIHGVIPSGAAFQA
jgi:hypothetical protein